MFYLQAYAFIHEWYDEEDARRLVFALPAKRAGYLPIPKRWKAELT